MKIVASIMPPLKTSIHTFNKEERSEVRVQCEAANNMSTLAKLQYLIGLYQFALEPQNENVDLKSSEVQIFYIKKERKDIRCSFNLDEIVYSYIEQNKNQNKQSDQ